MSHESGLDQLCEAAACDPGGCGARIAGHRGVGHAVGSRGPPVRQKCAIAERPGGRQGAQARQGQAAGWRRAQLQTGRRYGPTHASFPPGPPRPKPTLPRAAGAPGGAPPAPPVGQASQIQVLEIDAFQSVHDLIHSAIISNRGAASLKEVRGGRRVLAVQRPAVARPRLCWQGRGAACAGAS